MGEEHKMKDDKNTENVEKKKILLINFTVASKPFCQPTKLTEVRTNDKYPAT